MEQYYFPYGTQTTGGKNDIWTHSNTDRSIRYSNIDLHSYLRKETRTMKNTRFETDHFSQERNYADFFCLQIDLDSLCTMVTELQESMWSEVQVIKELAPITEKPTENLEKRITAFHLVTDKLYDLARLCEATDNRPQGGRLCMK